MKNSEVIRMANYIDVLFRGYGENFFGKEAMDRITDEQVEEARIYAMTTVSELTKQLGLQKKGTAKELFCNYIFGVFM